MLPLSNVENTKRSTQFGAIKVEIDGEITSAFYCPVCLNFFNKPKILPGCGHSLCLGCAEEILRGKKTQKTTLVCPECRSDNTLGPQGVHGLKTNFSIQRAIEIFGQENSARKQGTLGERCPHHDLLSKSSTTCNHCNRKFCNACLNSHLELLKLEACWIVSDFQSRYDRACDATGEQLKALTVELDQAVESASTEIVESTEAMIESFRTTALEHRDRLLAQLEAFHETQRAKLEHRSGGDTLLPQIAPTVHAVEKLKNSSSIYTTAAKLLPVYEKARRLDKELSQLEDITIGFHFDKIEFEFNPALVEQFAHEVVDCAKLTEIKADLPQQADSNEPCEVRKFREAVKAANFDLVKSILERPSLTDDCRRFIVSSKDANNFTPLIHAACAGSLELVRYLVLEHDADIFARSKESDVYSSALAIHWAAQNGHLEIVKFLLETAPEQIDEKCGNGSTLLQCASYGGHVDVIEYLVLVRKADVGLKNSQGMASVHLAAQNGQEEAVRWLIEHGADPISLCGKTKATILQLAVVGDNVGLVRYLVDKFPDLVGMADAHGNSALHYAAIENCMDIAEYLKQVRPQLLKVRNKDRETPLDVAINEGHFELSQIL